MSADIVFVAPVGATSPCQPLHTLPHHLLRLAAFLKQRFPDGGFPVIDMAASCGIPLSEEGEREVHARFQDVIMPMMTPRTIVGVTVVSLEDAIHVLPVARWLKDNLGCPVVFGGYMAHLCAREILQSFHAFMDAVICGPGEIPCVAMVHQMRQYGRISWHTIPGAAFYHSDEIVMQPVAASVPMRTPVEYDSLVSKKAYSSLIYATSRGCPRQCQFCNERKVHPSYQCVPPDTVRQDLDAGLDMISWTPRRIILADSDFAINGVHYKQGLRAVAETGAKAAYMTHVNALHIEDIQSTAEATSVLFLGVEAASEELLLRMRKCRDGAAFIRHSLDLVRVCFETGVVPSLGLMPFYPGIRQADLSAMYRYVDEVARMHASLPGARGWQINMQAFYVIASGTSWPTETDRKELGCTCEPAFSPEYHGIEIPASLSVNVRDPSREVSREDVAAFTRYALQAFAAQLTQRGVLELVMAGHAGAVKEFVEHPDCPPAVFASPSRQVVDTEQTNRWLQELWKRTGSM